MKQQERQERSRREIFQAAMEEFGAHGYDKVSMENLCTRHGISKGMMYHYYSNKDELFLLCVQDVFQNLKARIEQEIVQLEQQSPLAAIREFFLLRERYFQQNPERERIFETALLHPPRHLMGQIGALHAPHPRFEQALHRPRRLPDAAAPRPDAGRGDPLPGMHEHVFLAGGGAVPGGKRGLGRALDVLHGGGAAGPGPVRGGAAAGQRRDGLTRGAGSQKRAGSLVLFPYAQNA